MVPVHRRLLWILVLVGSMLLSTASAAAADDAEQRIVELVNAERARHGLPPLVVSAELTRSARAYALTMGQGNFFGHVGPDGSSLVTRNEAAGYRNWTYLAENLAAGQRSPEEAMNGWLNSASHRENVLSPEVREIGVGHAVVPGSKYINYWVQEFGNRPSAPQQALQAAPRDPAAASTASPQTAQLVNGERLSLWQAQFGIDVLGLPRTEVIPDPDDGGRLIQVFQRTILEFHPENPLGHQVQRRLLGDILYPGAEPPLSVDDAPPGPWHYFPFSPDRPTGLGHFVANYTRTGDPIYFKDFFDRHGGVELFGYPKEEPTQRNGRWTQRFQAAVFEYHPEFDRDGFVPGTNIPLRNYRVQLELLGDKYIEVHGLPHR